MNILYIIGNGFDLNIGLRTSYTDFYNYYNSLESTEDKVKFLKESISKDYKTWADLELGLGEFTAKLNEPTEFIEIFENISDELATYLEKEEDSFDFSLIDKDKFCSDLSLPERYLPAADLTTFREYRNQWSKNNWDTRIITLNYTKSIEKILKNEKPDFQIGTHSGSYQVNLRRLEHLHGYINDRMILGVNDISQIKNENFHNVQEAIEAMVKPSCNLASRATIDKVCENLIDTADLICIFGCSLGDTDKTWWERIGNRLKNGIKILIFTRGDEISRRRPYKRLPQERQIKKYFLDKTNLADSEKESFSKNIFIAINADMFSHMRTQS